MDQAVLTAAFEGDWPADADHYPVQPMPLPRLEGVEDATCGAEVVPLRRSQPEPVDIDDFFAVPGQEKKKP